MGKKDQHNNHHCLVLSTKNPFYLNDLLGRGYKILRQFCLTTEAQLGLRFTLKTIDIKVCKLNFVAYEMGKFVTLLAVLWISNSYCVFRLSVASIRLGNFCLKFYCYTFILCYVLIEMILAWGQGSNRKSKWRKHFWRMRFMDCPHFHH